MRLEFFQSNSATLWRFAVLLGTEVKRVRYLPFAYIGDSMKLIPTTDSLAKLGHEFPKFHQSCIITALRSHPSQNKPNRRKKSAQGRIPPGFFEGELLSCCR
jgi:hypothetical protein